MGYMKFREDRKPDRRRSKTAGTGTGQVTTGMIRIQLDAKTIIFCKDEEAARRAKIKWISKKENDQKYLEAMAEKHSVKYKTVRAKSDKKITEKRQAKKKQFEENSPF